MWPVDSNIKAAEGALKAILFSLALTVSLIAWDIAPAAIVSAATAVTISSTAQATGFAGSKTQDSQPQSASRPAVR